MIYPTTDSSGQCIAGGDDFVQYIFVGDISGQCIVCGDNSEQCIVCGDDSGQSIVDDDSSGQRIAGSESSNEVNVVCTKKILKKLVERVQSMLQLLKYDNSWEKR